MRTDQIERALMTADVALMEVLMQPHNYNEAHLHRAHELAAGVLDTMRDEPAPEIDHLREINKELLEACKTALRALPASADAIAVQCMAAIDKAEGRREQ